LLVEAPFEIKCALFLFMRRAVHAYIFSMIDLFVQVFVQLDELKGTREEREWKETARWIKYEEDVQEGTDRWGRPHVASLSFHSLLNVRRSLESGMFLKTLTIPTKSSHLSANFTKGVILLDLEEKDLPGVIYRVVEQMAVEELINQEDKAAVMRLLLLRHKHVHQDSDKFSRFIRRNTSSYTSLTVIFVY